MTEGRMTTACEWCGRAIVPDHDGRWLRAKPPFEVECDASEDGWHSPAAPGRETTRSSWWDRVRGIKPQEWCDLTYPHQSHVVNQYDSRYRSTLCRGIRPDGTAR